MSNISDMTKCHIAKSGNIIAPKGRLSYAQFLLEPQERTYEDSGKTVKVYNLNILVPGPNNKQGLPPADLTVLKQAMAKIALEKCKGDKNRAASFVNKRFLDPNNLPQGGKPMGEEFEGWILIRATSSYKPKFAYPNGKEIPAEEVENELYSGRWARPTLNPYWTDNKKNPGVCLGLQNVQLLDHDENLGASVASAEDEFGGDDAGGEASNDAGDAAGSTSDVDKMFG
jgi:hypothetical protein